MSQHNLVAGHFVRDSTALDVVLGGVTEKRSTHLGDRDIDRGRDACRPIIGNPFGNPSLLFLLAGGGAKFSRVEVASTNPYHSLA